MKGIFVKTKLFISYSDKDIRKVEILEDKIKLHQMLEPIVIANRKSSLKPLVNKVIEGIEESSYVIPLLTRNSINAQWINQEIGYAIAKGIKIHPIVERNVMSRLKGFIHKEVDIPFNYQGNINKPRTENINFVKALRSLFDHLRLDILPTISTTSKPSDVFVGQWRNEYVGGNAKGNELFIIEGENHYIYDSRHLYDIIDFKYDKEKKKISFKKQGIGVDKRVYEDTLKIINPLRFEGKEILLDSPISFDISYTKL